MPKPLLAPAILCGLATALSGCDDFAPPSELSLAQVVGVIAEPPIVAPGATTKLTPLIATKDGPVTGPADAIAARWSLTETLPGVAPFGSVTANADGSATYTAPAVVPPLPAGAPPVDSLQLTTTLDGRQVTTIKAVLVATVGTSNPSISGLVVDGVAIGAAMSVPVGAEVELAVQTTPAATDRARFAWYASVGELEQYQSNPARLLAKEPGQGWLYVVVRDGQLGVAWRAVPLTIQ